jgi:hypothetical protein
MNGEQLTMIVTHDGLINCNAAKEQLKYMTLLNKPIINPVLTVFESNKYDLEIRAIKNNNMALNTKRTKSVKYGPKSGMLKAPAINADGQIKLNNNRKKGAISFSRKCFIIDNVSSTGRRNPCPDMV